MAKKAAKTAKTGKQKTGARARSTAAGNRSEDIPDTDVRRPQNESARSVEEDVERDSGPEADTTIMRSHRDPDGIHPPPQPTAATRGARPSPLGIIQPLPDPATVAADQRQKRAARIKVQATQMGYYDHERRRPGDVFYINGAKDKEGNVRDFSPRWMVYADAKAQPHTTTSAQALKREQDALKARSAPRTDRQVVGRDDVGDNPDEVDNPLHQ